MVLGMGPMEWSVVLLGMVVPLAVTVLIVALVAYFVIKRAVRKALEEHDANVRAREDANGD